MIKFENTKVMNFEGALRGMRNPLESWAKSDSQYLSPEPYYSYFESPLDHIGDNDKNLAMKLALAGSDHGKFLRQIFVCVDITAPLYWWKEFDTYKVGTVANSTSTMHKLGSRLLTPEDFSWDDEEAGEADMQARLDWLEDFNNKIKAWQDLNSQIKETSDSESKQILQKKAKRLWRVLIQDLPSSFNQTRTATMNYENLRNMFFARKNHKLIEWHLMCYWIKELPVSELITTPRKSPREIKLERALNNILDILRDNSGDDALGTYPKYLKLVNEALEE